MSASNEWTEWHLTPRGWERGSERRDYNILITKQPPRDRVLTYKYQEHVGFSNLHRTKEKTYYHKDNILIERLLDRFGECPDNL